MINQTHHISYGRDEIDRLCEIQAEIQALVHEAKDIIYEANIRAYERAKGYWIAHIQTALSNDHSYLGGSMFTMQGTIDELEAEIEDREGQGWYDEDDDLDMEFEDDEDVRALKVEHVSGPEYLEETIGHSRGVK